MFELIQLIEKSSQTVHSDFRRWFKRIPAAATWNVLSDYSIGDRNKQNDAFSFVVLLNHDTFENIASYIAAVAPRDIKAARSPSKGLLDYLSCPVSFSLNFVVERQSSHLKNAVTVEAMQGLVSALRDVVRDWAVAEPPNAAYYETLDRRLRLLAAELAHKRPALKLLRQIFLVASFAAIVLGMINDAKSPLAIRWISDRDAMFDRHHGIAFDLAWLLFQMMRRTKEGVIDLRRPQLAFATPGMDGVTEYAEFVRLPDFLAGTLADMKLPQMMFTHPKFPPVFNRLFVDTPNNAVIEIVTAPDRVTSRRIAFGKPPISASCLRRGGES
ncbi:hypothetical protein GOA58_29480 [Sinorhizobium meliloti]|uniref:hypothetical protein n=1 Tax=Rhizobium meliloti TaxID=382 RepID=UPI0012954DB5|nr:hypothetical protein [Sinorhizobium meliloti]MDW9451717.1 hypothetical protein [Sinorhizobium meliloti]MDW9662841.1 hypothetical protein [Sinorhizobium meliloti]MDX0052170.1 hypothetical protein [Sinorhizobium meliloti]MQW13111.1 hypothetical protein [Sinorhizobium meliloti]